ncbi:MAG: phosphate-starvation-inducible PsiE family protein [Actinomycetota bacterium]|nr:phosphate-starvation-inducible PsiE family protein [Actinomycetota bacterium]
MEPVEAIPAGAPQREAAPVEEPKQFKVAIGFLEHIQDIVTMFVGGALLALSLVLLVGAVVDAFRSHGPLATRATGFLDEVLLVLILVEVVHTVVLSLRSHTLQPEPFIIIGLIAAIRKLLFVLANQQHLSTAEFALFIATAVVFIGALIGVRRFAPDAPERRRS